MWFGDGMDPVVEWTLAQERVIELVSGAPDTAVRVPACPEWTVLELFSHMVGLGSDVIAGDEPQDHNDAWTAAQVARRRDRGVPQLVAEWRKVAEPLRQWMRERGPRPLADVIIHEQDLRGALRTPGAEDTPGLHAIRDRFTERVAAKLPAGPSVALVGQTWTWTPAGTVAEAPVVLRASDFDLARAVMGRRSAAQLRAWTERGDLTPHLSAFASLGPLPEVDLQS
ncbi:maleylpyruvate isomerase N-terminal domain-containing protein [Pseudonocardia pini]|uniref:maleylpyruvate isomerase N-terminal domain-containing protein n=1 Tax=Pseudonocardia pini TaxID=2758030 RepID=UPI0015F0DFC6|nr:maleylpyruvate isomerase N-terminal domain-containing protein [Pseudonocardia pini]